MPTVEKTKELIKDIKTLYELDLVKFEQTILKSDHLNYTIIYTPKLDIYDVIIEDYKKEKLINYQSFPKLSGSTLKYFNLLQNQEYDDGFGNKFKCISHTIEYELY